MSGFSRWLDSFSWGRRKYMAILSDPERKSKCVRYGIISIILSVITPLIVFLCIKGAVAMLSVESILVIFTVIFGITLAVMAFLFIVYFLPLSLVFAIRQLKMDKKAGGYIGIIFNILSIAAVVAAVVLSLNI